MFLDLDANQVFRLPAAIFSDGNAALSKTSFYTDSTDLDKLAWETINCPGDYYGSSGKCYKPEWKRRKSSEVLVPEKVPPEYICRIVVYNKHVAEDLANKVKTAGTQLNHPLKYDPEIISKYYF